MRNVPFVLWMLLWNPLCVLQTFLLSKVYPSDYITYTGDTIEHQRTCECCKIKQFGLTVTKIKSGGYAQL